MSLALVAVFAALIAASTIWGGYPLGGGVPIKIAAEYAFVSSTP